MSRPPKIRNLMSLIKEKAAQGDFILMPHAVERRFQRSISIPDIVQVLTTGWHESKKDTFREEYQAWNYAVRGMTVDKRTLRVVVSLDEENMLVITVIHLHKRSKK